MCPACMTTMAWIAAGSASAGGFAAFVAAKLHKKPKNTGEKP